MVEEVKRERARSSEEEDVNSTNTTGLLMDSAMLQSGEFLLDDPLMTVGSDAGPKEPGSVEDELLFRDQCDPSSEQSPKTQAELEEHLQGCRGQPVKKPSQNAIPAATTSDETVTLSTETSDLPVPAVIYVFHKVPLAKQKPPSKLRQITKNVRMKLGFKPKMTLDQDDPEVYKETLVDL